MERCPYCFKPLPEDGECSCHYEDSRNARIEEALRPGTVVGACYQIGAVLGQGGFGITYRGYDLNMKKVVAIKEFYPKGLVIRYGTGNDKAVSEGKSNFVRTVNTEGKDVFRKSLDLFYREAEALGRLDKQPNVVHAHHIFRENETAYIVMEFVEGQSLNAMIQERERIPEEELIPLLEPVLTALDRAHQEGILHRDIAPDNIMIENGVPILLDFGASRVEEGHHSSLVIGKRGFSSYEQMAGGTQDRRSDIYAMGATYYNALSGIIPQDAAVRMMKDEVVPLKDLGFGISESTSDAVAKAMALSPDGRWNTAAEFRDALRENPGGEDKEPVYLAALKLMDAGSEEGYSGALFLFKQIPGYKDSEKLAKVCERKAGELQKQPLPADEKPTGDGGTVSPDTGGLPQKNKKLPFILAAAAVLVSAALFIVLRSCTGPSGLSKQEMTLTALADYRETSTAGVIQTKTQQAIDTELTAIAGDRATGTAYYHETGTKQAEPTETPVPPTGTPEPNNFDPESLAEMGIDSFQNEDYDKALEYLVPSAEAGNVDAQFYLGYMYDHGKGVEQSYGTAVKYYRMAADRGHAVAQCNIAYIYLYGMDVEQSYETALKYFQMAADQGQVVAQGWLGYLYEYGEGVEQSYEKAIQYYRMAADQGDEGAAAEIKKMTEIQTKTAEASAARIPTDTPIPTATNTPEPSATNTPKPTVTNTPEPSATNTPKPTAIPAYISADWEIKDNVLLKYSGKESNAVIPDVVTSIGESAFFGCDGLSSVAIPDSVASIGDSAFYNCSSLSSVTIPDSVTSIGDSAFYNCSGLRSVSLPGNITSIGMWTFSDCVSLSSVTIPENVISIGDNAFSGCSSLSSVTIPKGTASIGDYAFSGCSSLKSVTIPDSVTSIGAFAFSDCENLSSITIPAGVTSIGNYAFYTDTKIIVSKNSYAEQWCRQYPYLTCTAH